MGRPRRIGGQTVSVKDYEHLIDHAAWALWWCLMLWSVLIGGTKVVVNNKEDK